MEIKKENEILRQKIIENNKHNSRLLNNVKE